MGCRLSITNGIIITHTRRQAPMTARDHPVPVNTSRFNRPQATAVAPRILVVSIPRSLRRMVSTAPFSSGKGDGFFCRESSLGLITGVLHRGHSSSAPSSSTPQLTQYDMAFVLSESKIRLSPATARRAVRASRTGCGCSLFSHECRPAPACERNSAPHLPR